MKVFWSGQLQPPARMKRLLPIPAKPFGELTRRADTTPAAWYQRWYYYQISQ
jgi:hypothetical protein